MDNMLKGDDRIRIIGVAISAIALEIISTFCVVNWARWFPGSLSNFAPLIVYELFMLLIGIYLALTLRGVRGCGGWLLILAAGYIILCDHYHTICRHRITSCGH